MELHINKYNVKICVWTYVHSNDEDQVLIFKDTLD